MSQLTTIGLLFLTVLLSFLFSLTPFIVFLPQLVALSSIIFIIFNKYHLPTLYLISFLITLIVFSTNGLQSPFFFLIYFLLFITSFRYLPSTSLAFALIIILFLSQSLNSTLSLIPLCSLLFITPLVWFVSRQTESKNKTVTLIAHDETDLLFWLNLKFKTGITTIIDLASQTLSSPNLTYTQKEQIKKIKSSAKSLLNSSQALTQEIGTPSDEI